MPTHISSIGSFRRMVNVAWAQGGEKPAWTPAKLNQINAIIRKQPATAEYDTAADRINAVIRKQSAAAEPGIAADRFAREIVGF